jgi:serine/threonine protein kinase
VLFIRSISYLTVPTCPLFCSVSIGRRCSISSSIITPYDLISSHSFHQSLDSTHNLTWYSVLKLVNHPNIIRMEGLYESKQYLYIVMEMLTGGELFERIVGRPRYVFPTIRSLLECHSCRDGLEPVLLPPSLPPFSLLSIKGCYQ